VRPLHRDDSTESARAVLLRDVEPLDYYVGGSTASTNTASTNGSDYFYGPESSGQYYQRLEVSGGTGLNATLGRGSAHNQGSLILYQGGTATDSFIPDTTGSVLGGLPISRDRVGPPPRGLFDDV
jgi:hypothetical protein